MNCNNWNINMRIQHRPNILYVLIVVCLSNLTGCAEIDSKNSTRAEGPTVMGKIGRGGKKGPPGNLDHHSTVREQSRNSTDLTPEAIVACENKNRGEEVKFVATSGEVVDAKCMEYEDHLVAFPIEVGRSRGKK